jgi:hypothetical protein
VSDFSAELEALIERENDYDTEGKPPCTYWQTCHSYASGDDFDVYGEFMLGWPDRSMPLCRYHAGEFENEPGPWNGW